MSFYHGSYVANNATRDPSVTIPGETNVFRLYFDTQLQAAQAADHFNSDHRLPFLYSFFLLLQAQNMLTYIQEGGFLDDQTAEVFREDSVNTRAFFVNLELVKQAECFCSFQ